MPLTLDEKKAQNDLKQQYQSKAEAVLRDLRKLLKKPSFFDKLIYDKSCFPAKTKLELILKEHFRHMSSVPSNQIPSDGYYRDRFEEQKLAFGSVSVPPLFYNGDLENMISATKGTVEETVKRSPEYKGVLAEAQRLNQYFDLKEAVTCWEKGRVRVYFGGVVSPVRPFDKSPDATVITEGKEFKSYVAPCPSFGGSDCSDASGY